MINRILLSVSILAIASSQVLLAADAEKQTTAAIEYSKIERLLAEHCLDCHAHQDPEAKFVMETHELLMKGGESGPAIIPGKSSESLLVKMIEGNLERDGKKRIMPPGKRKKLSSAEIELVRAWIDAGAKGPPAGQSVVKDLVVPKITPLVPPRNGIQGLAYQPSHKWLAVGRYGEVEFRSAETRQTLKTLTGHRGNVNALAFSPDGAFLFAAAGDAGVSGEVRQWRLPEGELVRKFEGHRDALYSLAVSPDGKTLATGSYDQKIKLWNIETGTELKTLSGHNGAIYGLAFRPDGKILASASADRTVKLWDPGSGERRDTLSQSLKELYAVAFSPDGKRLLAAGVDNRIRVWQISESAAETTNPLLISRFAHEGAILRLSFSTDGKMVATAAEDRTVKIWDASEIKELRVLEVQPDWAPGLAFVLENQAVSVGRLDGTLEFYDVKSGERLAPPKPVLTRAEPRGVQRGRASRVRLLGSNLVQITELKLHHAKLAGEIVESNSPNELWVQLTPASDLPRGTYEVSVKGANGESGKIQVHVDDLPQAYTSMGAKELQLPISVWGMHERPGDAEEFSFKVEKGQTVVFDLSGKNMGSKADAVLTLADANGKVLASNNGFDGSSDPFLVYTFPEAGTYRVRVNELLLGASPDHYYRLSIGTFPFVTGCYPLSVPANQETGVELVGYNLPAHRKLKVAARDPGEMELPIDPERFRSRRAFKLIVGMGPELVETEPNDRMDQATSIPAPSAIGGRIWNKTADLSGISGSAQTLAPDVDLFRFEAKAGQRWIVETAAAQRGSPVDTKIEILHADGRPVERALLQAVRNSAVTFRGIDSNTADCRVENWEEMQLNEYLYLQGEVVKLFRAPQGPDSGFLFYTMNGRRRCYFDTSPTAHANEEPCYIVIPYPPGTRTVPNGLPVFTLFYANDDDADRKLGADSKIHFTAPADGTYLVRVSDSRGYQGERYAYRLIVREVRPDFEVRISSNNPTVNVGSGQSFTASIERKDGFEGEVTINISNVPPGFIISNPLVIEAGHNEAKGVIFATQSVSPADATATSQIAITALATVDGKPVTKKVNNFGQIKLGDAPKLYVFLEPDTSGTGAGAGNASGASSDPAKPLVITITPGQTVSAWLRVKRNGHDDLITFTVDNLPHGVIVDNIGLNGVLIPKNQNERQIFFAAERWVPDTDRLCYAVENQAGRQTSVPVLFRVRKPSAQVSAAR